MSRRTWTAVHSAINRSLKLAELRDHASRLFFHQLIQAVDSHGCIDARPHVLLVEVWPLLGETVASTEAAARELERVGLVVRKRDAKAEWLEIPDWNEKAGALIRKRGKRAFGAESVPYQSRTSAAPVQEKATQGQHKGHEGQHQSRTASNSNCPSTSSLSVEPSSSPRVLRTHAHEVEPSSPIPEGPSPLAASHLAKHSSLDVEPVRAAVTRWEAHLRDAGRAPWTASTWASNLVAWERWGPARTVAAIDTAIRACKFTPFEPRHGEAPVPGPKPTTGTAAVERVKRESDIERIWHEHEPEVEGSYTSPVTGQRVVTRGPARKYPGHESAEIELRERGLLAGSPDVRRSA